MISEKTPPQLKAMIDFRPFEAWRYNRDKVDLSKVIAPPYDVISSKQQKELYEKSPYNCIRLILNEIEPTDTDENNRYTRAAKHFEDWQRENILMHDRKACFYLYRQQFKHPLDGSALQRFSLLGRLRLEPFEKGLVIPHEKTLSKPREDRRKLLEATHTNFSAIFGLYEDPKHEIVQLYDEVLKEPSVFEATSEDGVHHTLWAVYQPDLIDAIHSKLSQRSIYIADGHHRYQTALEYGWKVRNEKNIPDGVELASDFVLTALVEFQDPGLLILPTHRIVLPYEGFNSRQALEALKPHFKIEPVTQEKLDAHLRSPYAGDDAVREFPSFGLVLGHDQYYWITLRDLNAAREKMPKGREDIWYKLDVSLLGHFIFEALWNLPESQWENTLRFTRYESEAVESVEKGKAVASFLLQTPRVEILREMGKARELMPQKSTYFYPKLETGLVFYNH